MNPWTIWYEKVRLADTFLLAFCKEEDFTVPLTTGTQNRITWETLCDPTNLDDLEQFVQNCKLHPRAILYQDENEGGVLRAQETGLVDLTPEELVIVAAHYEQWKAYEATRPRPVKIWSVDEWNINPPVIVDDDK